MQDTDGQFLADDESDDDNKPTAAGAQAAAQAATHVEAAEAASKGAKTKFRSCLIWTDVDIF